LSKERQITFTIEGLDKLEGDVDLRAFLDEADRFRRALKMCDDHVAGRKTKGGSFIYRVVALSHSSPATIGVVPVPAFDGDLPEQHAFASFEYFSEALSRFRVGDSEGIPHEIAEVFRAMAKGVGERFSRAWMSIDDSEFRVAVDEETRKAAEQMETQETRAFGTVKGTVRVFNSNADRMFFRIFPKIGHPVKCEFRESAIDEMVAAVNH